MKDTLVKKAIEILEDLKSLGHYYEDPAKWQKRYEEKIEVLKTGDEEEIKEFFRSCLNLFFHDLEDDWDCYGYEAEHFNDTSLEVIARLYLNEPITYNKRNLR